MAYGSFVKLVSSQFEGGPKIVSGTVSMISGDVGGSIDFSGYFGEKIDAVQNITIYKSGAAVGVITIDFTTVATTLTHTHSDPVAAATMYITLTGT